MNRFSNYRTKRRERTRLRCQAMARRSNEVQAAARLLREPDADTLRWRALHDARGQVIREGVTYTAGKETRWLVCRSRAGRTNQVDLVVDGTLRRTGAMRTALRAIRRGAWTVARASASGT